ncbi:MAG TPA: ABC transporter permease [Bryobacteraceae bacterium]|nr:ABC transporter permease [Bryobacteraceae bacterium]
MPLLTGFFDRLRQDLHYGARMLRSKPGFTAVAVLSVALGIGATTAIFSVVYAVLIDPYPYRSADRIGQLVLTNKKHPRWDVGYTKAQYSELTPRLRSMEEAAAVDSQEVVMTGSGLAEVVRRARCSPNFFDFFGVPPLFGRVFTAHNGQINAVPEPIAVISYKFWQRVFQGRRDILGKQIRLNDDVYTIVGVLPVRFTWMDEDVYAPMDLKSDASRFVTVFYRIRPGVNDRQLNAEFQPILQEFRRQVPRYVYPEDAFTVRFLNVNEGILGKFATTLLVLFGAVTLLLLIGCANVANLLLARAAAREGEMAVRVSIGATRMRLVRQLLTESILLALMGGVFGIGLTYLGIRAVIALMPEYSIPHEAVIALNWPVLWFAVGISVLTGIVFGLAPAMQASGETQADTLRGSGRGTSIGARRKRLHDALMVAEIALSLVLLTGAGMAIRGLFTLQNQQLGYNPRNALTFQVPLSEGRYKQWPARLALYQEIVGSLRRTPQVVAVAISGSGTPPYNGFRTKGILDDRPPAQAPDMQVNLVQDGYFAAVGTSLLRGRDISAADVVKARPVAVVTEDMVKREFGGKDPLGHHIQVDLFTQPIPPEYLKSPQFNNSFEIVGVVDSARNRGLNEPAMAAMFVPYSILLPPNAFVIARTSGDPNKLIGAAREAVRAADKNQPITLTRTLEGWLETATAYQSFSTFLFGVFGAVGMLLAAAGVFGVVSYSVEHRTREFGVRMALGADPRDVLKLVLAATTRILGVGLIVGIGLSVLASHTLADRMQGIGIGDSVVFAFVPVLLIITTLAASFFPARSATRIQPIEALRHD